MQLQKFNSQFTALQLYHDNSGLNGIWGWIKRNIVAISTVLTAVGLVAVATALTAVVAFDNAGGFDENGFLNTNSNQRGSADTEPTPAETILLDNWVKNQLTPFYQNLLIQLKSAFDLSNHDMQLQIINKTMMKMCIVKAYYKTNETNGLSANAIRLRNELIDTIFIPVNDLIDNSIVNYNNVVLSNYTATATNGKDFSPLGITSFSATCEKYNSISNNSATLLTVTPVVLNPITNQVITAPAGVNATTLGLDILPDNTTPDIFPQAVGGNTLSTYGPDGQPTPPKPKNNNLMVAIGLFGVSVLIALSLKKK